MGGVVTEAEANKLSRTFGAGKDKRKTAKEWTEIATVANNTGRSAFTVAAERDMNKALAGTGQKVQVKNGCRRRSRHRRSLLQDLCFEIDLGELTGNIAEKLNDVISNFSGATEAINKNSLEDATDVLGVAVAMGITSIGVGLNPDTPPMKATYDVASNGLRLCATGQIAIAGIDLAVKDGEFTIGVEVSRSIKADLSGLSVSGDGLDKELKKQMQSQIAEKAKVVTDSGVAQALRAANDVAGGVPGEVLYAAAKTQTMANDTGLSDLAAHHTGAGWIDKFMPGVSGQYGVRATMTANMNDPTKVEFSLKGEAEFEVQGFGQSAAANVSLGLAFKPNCNDNGEMCVKVNAKAQAKFNDNSYTAMAEGVVLPASVDGSSFQYQLGFVAVHRGRVFADHAGDYVMAEGGMAFQSLLNQNGGLDFDCGGNCAWWTAAEFGISEEQWKEMGWDPCGYNATCVINADPDLKRFPTLEELFAMFTRGCVERKARGDFHNPRGWLNHESMMRRYGVCGEQIIQTKQVCTGSRFNRVCRTELVAPIRRHFQRRRYMQCAPYGYDRKGPKDQYSDGKWRAYPHWNRLNNKVTYDAAPPAGFTRSCTSQDANMPMSIYDQSLGSENTCTRFSNARNNQWWSWYYRANRGRRRLQELPAFDSESVCGNAMHTFSTKSNFTKVHHSVGGGWRAFRNKKGNKVSASNKSPLCYDKPSSGGKKYVAGATIVPAGVACYQNVCEVAAAEAHGIGYYTGTESNLGCSYYPKGEYPYDPNACNPSARSACKGIRWVRAWQETGCKCTIYSTCLTGSKMSCPANHRRRDDDDRRRRMQHRKRRTTCEWQYVYKNTLRNFCCGTRRCYTRYTYDDDRQ